MQKLGNSLRAAEHLSHAINVLKETGKAEATAVDLLLWRVMGHCWPLPQEPEFSPVDTHLQRMEHAPSPEKDAATFDPPPLDSCLVRSRTLGPQPAVGCSRCQPIQLASIMLALRIVRATLCHTACEQP